VGEFLREVEYSDLSKIRLWRNHQDINRYMFTQHEVTEKEHNAWFEASEENELRSLFIYENEVGAQGFLQLQRATINSGVYDWGFYIDPSAERGFGVRMAKLAFEKVFTEMDGVKLFGEVLSFNLPSIKFHQKLGFSQEGLLKQHHLLNKQYHDVYCFGLLQSEFLEKRNRITL